MDTKAVIKNIIILLVILMAGFIAYRVMTTPSEVSMIEQTQEPTAGDMNGTETPDENAVSPESEAAPAPDASMSTDVPEEITEKAGEVMEEMKDKADAIMDDAAKKMDDVKTKIEDKAGEAPAQ